MQISSPAFANNRLIPDKHSCRGENVNPALRIKSVPVGTKSLALVVHDPDAPAKDWVHWLVWNIDPTTMVIKESDLPAGAVEGITDFGGPGYGGPCPPSGTHRYFFELFALDTVLDLPADASLSALQSAMDGHILERAELIGLFSAA